MKISIPTDDGEHVSEAFGHARYFWVVDTITRETELRNNVEAHNAYEHPHSPYVYGRHRKAEIIAGVLKDVEIVITSHIGKPMVDRMLSDGKIIYIAPKKIKILDALDLYFKGQLKKIKQEV
ncbi:MAG: NifB/NifX family molybdenum-iron cluster-binding protein [Candidatus Kryptonium sp.]